MGRILTSHQRGFTIVELLIVIVVIAILAAISIVAYNGIQTRATVSNRLADLQTVDKAIKLYFAQNGTYPPTGGSWRGLDQSAIYVPGVVPTFISILPPQLTGPVAPSGVPNTSAGYAPAYIYRTNAAATEYKLIAHSDQLCDEVQTQQPSRVDPIRNCWGYGYWSSGGSGL